MLFQLSTGKTISISIEQFLSMTDEDEQYLVSLNMGDVILSPFFRSAINIKQIPKNEEDNSVDFIDDSEEVELNCPQIISFDELSLDLPEIEEDLD